MMRRALAIARAAAIAVALAACGDNAKVPPPTEEVTSFPAVANPDLDLLFLIDDSTNAQNESSVADGLPALFEVLASLDTAPNVHVGVATSDLGTTGSLDPANPAPPLGSGPGACAGHGKDGVLTVNGAPVAGSYVIDVANPDATRMTNYTGNLLDVLARMVKVGSTGCGFEQHLAAIKRALTNPVNAGFLRPSANLGIILLGDEDDCSVHDAAIFDPDTTTLGPVQSFRCTRFGIECTEPIDEIGPKTNCVAIGTQYIDDVSVFADFLMSLKDDPRELMFAAIVGDPEPVAVEARAPPGGGTAIAALAHSCSFTDTVGGLEVADPAVRDAALVYSLPRAHTALTSICALDYSPQLTRIGHELKRTLGDPCFDLQQLADTDSDPGIQPACTVTDDDTPIPACPAEPACFEFVADPRACPDTVDHMRVVIHRTQPAHDGAYVHVRCEIP